MTTARSYQIDLNATSYYHCIARCVRRTYLCGYDQERQKDFSHRKQWIVDRIKLLSKVFYINICAYAVMSNHYHLVLHVNSRQAQKASLDELLYQWHLIFPSDAARIEDMLKAVPNNSSLAETMKNRLQERLSSISWYMRCLNETIAKMANQEDNCKGRFWEGRFKSQALLDEGALLSAMVYVDLNPIRANLADTPEGSDFTSIQERIRAYSKTSENKNITEQSSDLMKFSLFIEKDQNETIDYSLEDYLALVDTTGRLIKEEKRGYIPNHLPPLLERLKLSAENWFDMVSSIEKNFYFAIGNSDNLKQFVPSLSRRYTKCLNFVDECYLEQVASF